MRTRPVGAGADVTESVAVVPITVWRLDDRDGDQPATDPGAGFASRLARRLVLTYTRQGETVVDLDADRHLRDAATAASRTYLAITRPGDLSDLDTITDPVSLVIVRWPRQTSTRTVAGVADLFTACRLMMSADSCAIAAVSSAEPGQPGTAYAEHVAHLLPRRRPPAWPTSCRSSPSPSPAPGTATSSATTRLAPRPTPPAPTTATSQAARPTTSICWSSPPANLAVADGDWARIGGGASRRAAPGHRRAGDSPEVAESRGADAAPPDGESTYAPRAAGRPAPDPLRVRVELVVVDGPAAKELLKRQAAAVREALRWFADHPPEEGPPHDHSPPPPAHGG